MSNNRKLKRILLIFLVLGIIFVISGGIYYYLQNEKRAHELVLFGNVDVRQVDIGFRVPGQIETLYFEEGDRVFKGQLMAKLNHTPYSSQVVQAEANEASIRSSFELADKLVKRRQELIGIGGISQENLDDALTNRVTLQANLASAEAALTIAKDNLSYTQAFAPTDGIILTRIREPGTVVNASDPIYILSVSSPIWIRAYLNEPNLGRIHFGMPAEIYIDTPHTPVYTGKIGFISPVAEFTPKTVESTQLRTDLVYRLRIYIDNPDQILKQGMPVTIKLKLTPEGHDR